MFVKVHKPVNTPCVCDNKDRCRALVEYLLKESLEDKPYYYAESYQEIAIGVESNLFRGGTG